MVTQTGPRAAMAQGLITGRVYGRQPGKIHVNMNLDPRLVALAEQYKICGRMGAGGCQCMSDWITDRLIDAIREKRDAIKERDDTLLFCYDRMNEAVLFGSVPESCDS